VTFGRIGIEIACNGARQMDMPRICIAILAVAVLCTVSIDFASGLEPVVSPDVVPQERSSFFADQGFRLAVILIPVLLLALAWLGYIFWLIFHEGENVGSG